MTNQFTTPVADLQWQLVEDGYPPVLVLAVLSSMIDAGGGQWDDDADDMMFTPREVEVCCDQLNSRAW